MRTGISCLPVPGIARSADILPSWNIFIPDGSQNKGTRKAQAIPPVLLVKMTGRSSSRSAGGPNGPLPRLPFRTEVFSYGPRPTSLPSSETRTERPGTFCILQKASCLPGNPFPVPARTYSPPSTLPDRPCQLIQSLRDEESALRSALPPLSGSADRPGPEGNCPGLPSHGSPGSSIRAGRVSKQLY